jgi:ABC-type nitrate/sulfonate/bicarbonate transport system substrate-binding protein
MQLKPIAKVFFCALLILGFAARGETQPVRVAVAGLSGDIHVLIAKEKGYYRDEGLQPEIILMSSGVANQALIGGSVEFSTQGGTALPAVLRGAPIRFLFFAYQRPAYSLYSTKQIYDFKDLKGKKVGVSNIGSSSDFLLREVLIRHGLDGGRDVVIVAAGTNPTRYAALETGSVAATMLLPPFTFQADQAGFRELASFIKEDSIALASAVGVREDLLKSDPILVEKFLRATFKGYLYVRENRAGALPFYSRALKITENLASKMYDVMVQTMTPDGTLTEDVQKRAIDQTAKILGLKKTPPLEGIFDFSLTQKIRGELESSGWRPDR